MSKVKQKELDKIKGEKEKKRQEYDAALKSLISGEETMRITLDFCEEFFKKPMEESLEEYSPIHISRLIFDQQLQKIKQ
jgi:hypothetical protein